MRRRVRHIVFLIVALVALKGASEDCLAKARRKGSQDQLLSFTHAFDTELRPTLEEKLLVTPASYGRMIRMHGGPGVGESAVSVYCTDAEASDAQCHVTLTRAKENLDYNMAEHRGEDNPLQKVREIPIVRKDAEIPKTAATAFRDCLRIMIPEQGDPHRLHPLTIAHDDRIEFWLDEPNAAPRKGERAEDPGKRTRTLIHIGDLLARYVEAAPSERAPIAKQIEKEAARILSKGSKPKTKE